MTDSEPLNWLGPGTFLAALHVMVVRMYVLGCKLIEDEKRSQE